MGAKITKTGGKKLGVPEAGKRINKEGRFLQLAVGRKVEGGKLSRPTGVSWKTLVKPFATKGKEGAKSI